MSGSGTVGRPRDAAREEALLAATVEVLDELGYEALTVDAVARRAHASKATMYRRWPSKEDLLCAALLNAARGAVPLPDTGCLTDDLRQMLRAGARALQSHRHRITAIAAAVAARPDLADSFDRVFLTGRRDAARTLYQRAVERGELAPGADLDLLVEAAPALLLHRVVYQPREPLDEAFVDRVIDNLLVPALLRAGSVGIRPEEYHS